MNVDLIVLGAGPAGLAAAWRAALRGRSVVVLERAAAVGGLAGSFEVAGVRVDYGSHRLHPATPPRILADLRALLGSDLQTRPRNGRLRVWDRWVGFPLRSGELARTVPPSVVRRLVRDAALRAVPEPLTYPLDRLARRGRRPPGEPSYASVLERRLGPELYRALYAPYAQKLWGLSGDAIDAEQARVRVRAGSPVELALRALRAGRGKAAGGQGQLFRYPRRGFGQLVEALADAATAAGAEIRLGADITQVWPLAGRALVHTGSSSVEAGHVFSTLPLPVLATLLRPALPIGALADAQQLAFRAMVLVYLVHGGGSWTEYDAHYFPGLETPVSRVSEPTNYRDSTDDPADRSVLCAEVPCGLGDRIWKATPDELAAMVVDCLAASGLPPVRLAGVEVRRLPRVYPIYRIGYQRHLAAVDEWVGRAGSVTSFGRLGLFAHDNTHHALTMAYDAVDALQPDGGFDHAAWAAARQRFASHVVED